MKKIALLALGFGLFVGSVSFAQDPKNTTKKETKKNGKKKSPKSTQAKSTAKM